jgi:hypothetical protein
MDNPHGRAVRFRWFNDPGEALKAADRQWPPQWRTGVAFSPLMGRR